MRSYNFLRCYPDRGYKEKFTRIAKAWGYGLILIVLAILIWAGLGAPVSYGGYGVQERGHNDYIR